MVPNASPLKTTKPNALPQFANIGIGGAAGAGKTHLLATAGKDAKVLVLDTEGGTVTYNSPSFLEDPAATADIDIIEFGGETKAQDLVQKVEGALDYLIRSKNKDGYSLVALDSLTEFQEKFLALHKATVNDPRQSYGALKDALYRVVTKARQVPTHTVFTARLKFTEDPVSGKEVVRFDVAPGVYSVVSGLFDSIGFLTLKSQGQRQQRTLDFQHGVRTQGKDRYGLGDMVNPTFAQVISKIKGA